MIKILHGCAPVAAARRLFLGAPITAIAIVALSAAAIAQSGATGKSKFNVKVSGEVNRAILYANDGTDRDTFFVDSAENASRVRVEGIGRYSSDLSVHAVVDVAVLSNPTSAVDIGQNSSAGFEIEERHIEIYADHRRYGRLSLGQGDTASNGTSEADLSGTKSAGYSLVSEFAGGVSFVGFGNPQINEVFSNMDGFGRDDRVRYDTPSFSGFKVSTSFFENGDGWDLAARYNGRLDKIQIAGAVAFGDSDGLSQLNGSISGYHRKSGISATLAAGQQNGGGGGARDPFFWYAKLGYRVKAFDFGELALAFDYTQADDISGADEEFASFGLMAVQKVDKISTEIYLAIRTHSFEVLSVEADDVFGFMIGARAKF